MKRNKTLVLLLLAGMVLCGCQKQDDAPNESNGKTDGKKSDQIAAITIYDGKGDRTITFTYDEKGRLVRTNSDVAIADTYYKSRSFAYGDSKIVETIVCGNSSSFTKEWALNGKGDAASFTEKDGSGAVRYTSACRYDSDGYLVQQKDVAPENDRENLYSYTIENGNVVKEEWMFSGRVAKSITYTYYSDKPNMIGGERWCISFCGKQSKNLVKSKTEGGHTLTYTYEFDSKNRVAKRFCSIGSYIEFSYVE